MVIDFNLDEIDIGEEPKNIIRKLLNRETVVHNNGNINRMVSRYTPTLSQHGILLATNHRRTGKSIVALDLDAAKEFPNFDNMFKKEIDGLIKAFKKGDW